MKGRGLNIEGQIEAETLSPSRYSSTNSSQPRRVSSPSWKAAAGNSVCRSFSRTEASSPSFTEQIPLPVAATSREPEWRFRNQVADGHTHTTPLVPAGGHAELAVGVFVEAAGGAKPGVEHCCRDWATVPDQGLESVQSAGVGVLPRGQARFLLKYTLQVGGTDADGLAQLGKGRQAIRVLVEVRVDLMADTFHEAAIAILLPRPVWEAAQTGSVARRLGLFEIRKESNVVSIGSAAGADGATVNAGGTYGVYEGAVVCRVSVLDGFPQDGRGGSFLRVILHCRHRRLLDSYQE